MASLHIVASPTSLDFGTVAIGSTSSTRTLEITWDSGGSYGDNVIINGLNLPANFNTTTTFPIVLSNVGDSCDVNLTFTAATAGTDTGLASVESNASGGANISLTGAGSSIKIVPTSDNFGAVKVGNTSSQVLFQINNLNSSGTLTINSITIPAPFAAGATMPALPYTIPASGSVNFGIVFSPTLDGPVSATAVVVSTDLTSPTDITLSGSGVPPFYVGHQLPFFSPTSGLVSLNPLPLTSVEIVSAASNGGLSGAQSIITIPSQQFNPSSSFIVAVQDYDLQQDTGFFYVFFPAEDTLEYRPVTIKKIVLVCQNASIYGANISYSLAGILGSKFVSTSGFLNIDGTSSTSQNLIQVETDVVFTANLFQLSIIGSFTEPFSIVKVKLIGTISQDELI